VQVGPQGGRLVELIGRRSRRVALQDELQDDRVPCGRGGCTGYLAADEDYCGWCGLDRDED